MARECGAEARQQRKRTRTHEVAVSERDALLQRHHCANLPKEEDAAAREGQQRAGGRRLGRGLRRSAERRRSSPRRARCAVLRKRVARATPRHGN
jgi:hypothetical protein